MKRQQNKSSNSKAQVQKDYQGVTLERKIMVYYYLKHDMQDYSPMHIDEILKHLADEYKCSLDDVFNKLTDEVGNLYQ